jgi:DNA (cytosine-5)-methyltransferase 1
VYTHASLFAGLGGFVLAANRAGLVTTFANEIDPECATVLQRNFADLTVSADDVRHVSPAHFPEGLDVVDVLSAGFPCQSFSQAGENQGFDDERGQLFFEIPRLCKQLPAFPKVVLLENVPFLKQFDGGSRLSRVVAELRKVGYWVSESNAQILDSYDHGDTPQRRERLFIVAVHSAYFRRNKFSFPETPVQHSESLWEIIDRSCQASASLYIDPDNKYARMILRKAKEAGRDRLFQIRRTEVRACPPGVCPTLTANMGGGGHNVPFVLDDFGIRRLSVAEVARLQCIRRAELSFPADLADSGALRMLGNAICVDVAERLFVRIGELLDEAKQ